MKTASEILSVLFDERFMKKAQGYSKLFDSWADVTAKNGIAAASAHSRIRDLDKGILLVETDHPGWKQIIQTKQSKMLNDYRRRFPDLGISGISLILGKAEPRAATEDEPNNETAQEPLPAEAVNSVEESAMPAADAKETSAHGLDAIKDEDFKKILKNLEKSIADGEKSGKKR